MPRTSAAAPAEQCTPAGHASRTPPGPQASLRSLPHLTNSPASPTPVFEDLNQYEATTHFNGQSTVALDGAWATGESYTIAHHLFTKDGERKIMIASLRYLDTFVKTGDAWLFAERNLILDWSETRPSPP